MKNNKGFSLVELIVVIAIMAILAAVAIPVFGQFITKAENASDADLLHNINYVFEAACMENGIDIKNVTAATWNKNDKKIEGIKVNGVGDTELTADIAASFVNHFELTDSEFINIKDIVFDVAKHEFVDPATADSVTLSYGGGVINISKEDLDNLKDSTFGDMGMAPLLGQLDEVAGIAATLDNALMNGIIESDDFRKSAAKALGINTNDADWDVQLSAKYNELLEDYFAKQNPPKTLAEASEQEKADAMAKIEANATVLYAANQTTQVMSPTDINNFLNAPSKQTIINNMDPNKTADPSLGLAQASLMCGLYTSYVNSSYGAGLSSSQKEVTVDNVLNAMEDDDFKAYLASEQGKKDKEGYLSSLNMISGSAQDPDAVSQLMINGFGDPELVGALNGTVGK